MNAKVKIVVLYHIAGTTREELFIQNITQKIIRGIELKPKYINNKETNIVDIHESKVKYSKRLVNDSELLRIVETIDSENVFIENGHKYLTGIISVNVGHNIPKYRILQENDGLLVLEHHIKGKEAPLCKEHTDGHVTERFVRAIVGSGHSRGSKALFIREDLFEKVHKILLGGIDDFIKDNKYPYYKKGYAKWNSYYALASTDSKVVNYVPKIVIVDDFERTVTDTFDMVYQDKSLNPKWKDGDDEKNKFKKKYRVVQNVEKEKIIMPFDGAGLVSIECAKIWSEELNCMNSRGKGYVPASFQFRIIPGFKGNLYTFDIKSFGMENGNIITDIKGVKHDITTEMVDIILTKSQAKFIGWFDDDVSKWREEFDKEVNFYIKDAEGNDTKEIDCSYRRTFNISEYAEDACDLKHKMLTAYQHLQTVDFKEDERESICVNTIEKIKEISTDVEKFLKFRSCTEENEDDSEWKRIPPYYRAAYYSNPENKKVIFNDDFFKSKVLEDIEGVKNRALAGKLYVEGNYQVLTPDIYALAQFAFGKEVKGLLKSEEIYSNWWRTLKRKDTNGKKVLCDYNEVALIRNPHIYMEARIAKLLRDGDEKEDHERYTESLKWFKYQTTGILTDSHSTIPLALGTADFDGDHIASTSCKEYISAVNRARENKEGNTVDYEINLDDSLKDLGEDSSCEMENVSDIKKLMEFDMLAFQNNIGTVIDKVTILWGMDQTEDNKKKLREFIVIADIIGQLTIDAAKTGEFEKFDASIDDYIKSKNAQKPYFMKYLSKNERKRKKEEKAIKNAEFFFGDWENSQAIAIAKKQEKFSNFNTNVNLLCHYLEPQFENILSEMDSNAFDLEAFFKIFVTEKVAETSDLYIRIKDELLQLMKELQDIFSMHKNDDSEDAKKDKSSHYRYFYSNARYQLLSQCKLTNERSLNKVVNILVTICYREKECLDNSSAKNILWNAFEDEMVNRAKGIATDKEIDFLSVIKKANKTKELKKKAYGKKLASKDVVISELENKKRVFNPIVITQSYVDDIRNRIDSKKLLKGKEIGKERAKELRKLYSVLLIISKRMEYDREIHRNGEKKTYHTIPTLELSKGNNTINKSNLAKLAGFNDTQRKNIEQMLKELNELDMIYIYSTNMIKPKFKVVYQVDNMGENIVNEDDYKIACKVMRQKFR